MNDVEQTAEPLERIEHGLLLWREPSGPRFGREFVHERMVSLGEPDLERRAGGARSHFAPKLNDPLPNLRAGIGGDGLGAHAKNCMPVLGVKEVSLLRAFLVESLMEDPADGT